MLSIGPATAPGAIDGGRVAVAVALVADCGATGGSVALGSVGVGLNPPPTKPQANVLIENRTSETNNKRRRISVRLSIITLLTVDEFQSILRLTTA
jgi:hypothetical protein